ncbi:hypothetical protein SpCBS45565_g05165 [Spizellomyces sp. 'palustris']|nr:hypothetical protein SpCBS45565_g05165 [Spizellomyces sp. 'palustris']
MASAESEHAPGVNPNNTSTSAIGIPTPTSPSSTPTLKHMDLPTGGASPPATPLEGARSDPTTQDESPVPSYPTTTAASAGAQRGGKASMLPQQLQQQQQQHSHPYQQPPQHQQQPPAPPPPPPPQVVPMHGYYQMGVPGTGVSPQARYYADPSMMQHPVAAMPGGMAPIPIYYDGTSASPEMVANAAQYAYYAQMSHIPAGYYYEYPVEYWNQQSSALAAVNVSTDQEPSGESTPTTAPTSPTGEHGTPEVVYSPTAVFYQPPIVTPYMGHPPPPPFSPTPSLGSDGSGTFLPHTPPAATVPQHSPYRPIPVGVLSSPTPQQYLPPHMPQHVHSPHGYSSTPSRPRRTSETSFGSSGSSTGLGLGMRPPMPPMQMGMQMPVSPQQHHHHHHHGHHAMGMHRRVPGSFPTNTNVYIRNLPSNMSDEMLYNMCRAFGNIVSSKSIIDRTTQQCRGYGFVMYETDWQARAAIEGIARLGYAASFARVGVKGESEPPNMRLRMQQPLPSPLQGQQQLLHHQLSQQHLVQVPNNNHNVYFSNLPADMTEQGMMDLFSPFQVLSTKILTDAATGTSRRVGFARFPTHTQAATVITQFNDTTLPNSDAPLIVRWADPKIQSYVPMRFKNVVRRGRVYRMGYVKDQSMPRLSSTEWPPLQPQEEDLERLSQMVKDTLGVGGDSEEEQVKVEDEEAEAEEREG